MPTLDRARQRSADTVRRAVARAARTRAGRTLRRRLTSPTVSVIVPFYNVELYLAPCLDSILGQSLRDIEVVLVDDGSPDGSRAIAEEYAARDFRVRLVTRENGGLGAARNTGVRHARGRFLTFVDSDDLLPAGALQTMFDSATATGSQIVVGSVERFNSGSRWLPQWVEDVHHERLERVQISDFLPLLRNLYTWNKLFRRDFWVEQELWFREGVSYEDQPIITQLLARASSIDVLPDIVYQYRQRDEKSSISQQTASLTDLRDRIAAWRVSRETFEAELSREIFEGWLRTLFDAHFHWYLTSPGTADDTYWNELVTAVRELAQDAPSWIWRSIPPARRVLMTLAMQDRREDAQEFLSRGASQPDEWPATVRDDGILLHLPFLGDPQLDESLFMIRPEQMHVSHAVEDLRWVEHPDGQVSCAIAGWAFLRKVDLTEHRSSVSVVLQNEVTGEERVFAATATPDPLFPPPREDKWCSYDAGTFGVEIPLSRLLADSEPGAVWTTYLRVQAAGFTATRKVTRVVRSGAAGALRAALLPDEGRLVADWRFEQPLRFRLDTTGVRVTEVELSGRTLSGRLRGAGAVSHVLVSAGDVTAQSSVAPGSDGTRAFSIDLPRITGPEPGLPAEWRVRALVHDGRPAALIPEDRVARSTPGDLVLETNRRAELVVNEWSLGAVADTVEVAADDTLRAVGRIFGAGVETVHVASRNKRMRAYGPRVPVVDGRFDATLDLRHELYRFGLKPLPSGDHDLTLVVSRVESADVEVPLRVSADLSESLPVAVATPDHQGQVIRGPGSAVRVTLRRPIGQARGRYRQNRLRLEPPSSTLTRGVLFRSYFGEQATDNGVSIQKELQRRGSDLPVYWAVQDHSVAVPEGGIPVVVNSTEWYSLLSSVKYYVDNMYQPDYHRKPDGQVMVQTFHGYPFKQMGHPHWENLGFSRAKIEAYDARAGEWDYLLSPARYATPLLTRDFAYDGDVLEIGYPRNDVLQSPEADDLRARTRASLGIKDGQTAVLYAPTFRDYMSYDDNRAVMADFFDFAEAHRALGDDYVLLIRGHAFNARSRHRVGELPGCVDVTDYPEVSDLYLAADAAIVDYSSLRFDFGVTGKPMIFHVPDIARYKDTRGWLFDFELTAPGPLVDSTAQVVERLLDLDGVRRDFADAYETFRKEYLDLEDGNAGRRFVDAVFVPRGDA